MVASEETSVEFGTWERAEDVKTILIQCWGLCEQGNEHQTATISFRGTPLRGVRPMVL
ncbi:hypothetical protein L798_11891 [Zootermopsis nevadensis]|uniref:Uncharacterized protein n=1 Tax=Zootermopsis nevadensis TaxID=136037 RepID=A0A067QY31_ZOONE|nr:hypothetical protein L798_11891 [Zootermopsis nevadensis]